MDPGLSKFVDCEYLSAGFLRQAVITVITNDGRVIVGTLRGYDQTTNLILEDCHERVYSTKYGVEQLVLGLYIIRGDNV
ncbi:unnamed protein product [Ostreobium quekettii]|uniref:U6 snRNA-associated Sm-like protein LSm8 n=1 Tax=Ostreobium quekettii TaxID=121088 RepID=A0A8S1JFY2_9CHLO|nr:unnamed protein product [Ostreobium quekettii]